MFFSVADNRKMSPQCFFGDRNWHGIILIVCLALVSVGLCTTETDIYVCPSRVRNADGKSELLGIRCTFGCCGTISDQTCCNKPTENTFVFFWVLFFMVLFGEPIFLIILPFFLAAIEKCLIKLVHACRRPSDQLNVERTGSTSVAVIEMTDRTSLRRLVQPRPHRLSDRRCILTDCER